MGLAEDIATGAIKGAVRRWLWPVPTYAGRLPTISSGFRTSDRADHQGSDIMLRRVPGDPPYNPKDEPQHGSKNFWTPSNWPARAVADGVITAAYLGARGWQVRLTLADTSIGATYVHYSHFSQAFVKVGQTVKRGETLGIVGDDPSVRDPMHLHFEVHNGPVGPASALDPAPFLAAADYGALAGPGGSLLTLGGVALLAVVGKALA
ncbi:MAG TPA: M23 family metallopeptidase [Solirubrobacteraceae bacterium]|nr:M23 family metallopeptidase [Solirubrobacteraceae bacterium]